MFGGDLARLGAREEVELGAQILKSVKAPVRMMVGEHDWFLDMGDVWKSLFGAPQYSFDHKGVHFVTLMSVQEKDLNCPFAVGSSPTHLTRVFERRVFVLLAMAGGRSQSRVLTDRRVFRSA